MSSTADLPDLNVWLALVWPEHTHHRQALKYWEHLASRQILFCTVTALGLVRLVCQQKLMGTAMKTPREASALLEVFCQQPGVGMAAGRYFISFCAQTICLRGYAPMPI